MQIGGSHSEATGSDLLAALEVAIDDVLAADPHGLSGRELLAESEVLAGLTSKLYAVSTRHLGVADEVDAHRVVRSRSLARCLTGSTGDSGRAVGRRVRHGAFLASHQEVWEALAVGEIAEAHVAVLVQVADREELAEAFGRDLPILVGWARNESYIMFWALVKAWAEMHDPTDPADIDQRALNNRGLAWAQALDGEVLGEIHAPNLCWDQILEACRPVYDRMWDEDRAAAKAAHGDAFAHSQLGRTDKQRWFDALMHVIRGGGVADVEVIVYVNDDTLTPDTDQPSSDQTAEDAEAADSVSAVDDLTAQVARRRCETRNGLPLTPAMALRLCLAGKVRRAVLDAPDLNLSTSTRLFRGPLRDAILGRDRFCLGDGCETPSHRCHLDHRRPVDRGGTTTASNGQPLCPACHAHKTKLEALGIW